MPSMYDTSTSSAGDSAQHSFFKAHSKRGGGDYSNPYSLAAAAKQSSRDQERDYASEAMWNPQTPDAEPNTEQDRRPWRHDNVTQSEPGTPQQRFSAYVNRFASMDPRMDHREQKSSRLVMAATNERSRTRRSRSRDKRRLTSPPPSSFRPSYEEVPPTVTPTGDDCLLSRSKSPALQVVSTLPLDGHEPANIETPSPARVKDLKEKLWDPNEELQVAVQPSWKAADHDNDHRRRAALRYRSVSPKSHQRSNDESNSSGRATALFKSKYYAAAQQQQSGRSRSKSPVLWNNSAAVASLVAKISAVSRDDPNAALAQIDAILRAESDDSTNNQNEKSSGAATATSPPRRVVEDDNQSVSSDDTSVSSITNPSYHDGGGVQNTPPEKQKYIGVSNRQQRKPSALSSYGNSGKKAVSQQSSYSALHGHRERLKNRHRSAVSPPPDVRLSRAAQEKAEKELSRSGGGIVIEEKKDAWEPMESTMTNNHSSDSAELAEKIKRWDVISTNVTPTSIREPSDYKHVTAEEPKVRSKLASLAAHSTGKVTGERPWEDPKFPVRMGNVDTRDTSMESALGVETTFKPKYQTEGGDDLPKIQSISQRSARTVDRYRKERSAKESDMEIRRQSRSLEEVEDADPFDVAPRTRNSTRETSWSPTQMTPQQQEHARNMADAFDSAWVDLPENAFFNSGGLPETAMKDQSIKSDVAEEHRPAIDLRSRQLDSYDSSAKRAESRRQFQSFSPSAHRGNRNRANSLGKLAYDQTDITSQDIGQEDSGVEVTLGQKEAPRRGLRGLLQKRRSKTSSAVVVDNTVKARPNGTSMNSTNHEATRSSSRGRRRVPSSQPGDRERAHSLEDVRRRGRSPNLAKKFSRLLRVYDSDKKSRAYI